MTTIYITKDPGQYHATCRHCNIVTTVTQDRDPAQWTYDCCGEFVPEHVAASMQNRREQQRGNYFAQRGGQ